MMNPFWFVLSGVFIPFLPDSRHTLPASPCSHQGYVLVFH